jgi:hypothetical protein
MGDNARNDSGDEYEQSADHGRSFWFTA